MNGMPTIIIIYLVFAFLPHYDSIKKKEQEVNPALLICRTHRVLP